MIRTFWSTFREVLIIVLGLVATNAFPGFLESATADKDLATNQFSSLPFFMLSTFLIIVFRFGFANIMLIEELINQDRQLSVAEKFNHLISFIILSISAILLGAMSYYVNWVHHGAKMYVLFVVLCLVDCVWDISNLITDRKASFRVVWLVNKLGYVGVVMLIWYVFQDEFNPFKPPAPANVNWGRAFFLVIVATWVSSFVSLVTGRRLFFPFLFQSNGTRPPPPLLPRDQDGDG